MKPSVPQAPPHEFRRVYVWELPVRFYHWINALCILVLAATGLIIAHPPAFVQASEASFSYWFGTVRFVHFVTAYVFVFNFAVRIYWGFVGNRYADWKNFLPLRRAQFREAADVMRVDVLQSRNTPVHAVGHNAVAYFTYFAMFLVFLFQVFSGFAMYSAMSTSWFPKLFAWITPLFGDEYALRQWHYAATWFFLIFTIIHVYLVFYHDYVEGHGVMSSMVGGWKFVDARVDEAGRPADGKSWFSGRRRVPPPENPS
ncbi:putative Ni/Fe-hydrogenase 1 B-type cytochrome subunit [mine drainage metagenome]|uniref:Putative Ni/Fe-hydrogenase 1 B-type cytochrome subunit n=1 Tax=mine drainage metagenome TaxID=410659 RepID=A0A1J5SYE2_9ZZZZ